MSKMTHRHPHTDCTSKVQEEMLVKRGELEEELMANSNPKPLKAKKFKGVGKSRGFGAGKTGKSAFKQEAKSYAKMIRKEGLARIDGVLTDELADNMREFAYNLRKDSEEKVQAGTVNRIDRFADVLLKSNRCDLKMPFGPKPVMEALYHVFRQSVVSPTIEEILSDQAVLYELSCLISDPGSQRQTVHPDNPMRASRYRLDHGTSSLVTSNPHGRGT